MGSSNVSTFFTESRRIPADRIFELTAIYVKDESPKKVNLGQGAYRDGEGNPWVLPSVRASRNKLSEQGLTHEYLPILGHPGFRQAAAQTVLGDEIFNARGSYVCTHLFRIPAHLH